MRFDTELLTGFDRENHWCAACSADGLTSYRESAA
jgi:hypothetical protein